MRLFLDTNIILDATTPDRLHKQEAQELLDFVSSGYVDAYMASFCVATVVYFLQKVFKTDTSLIIEQLLKFIEVVDLKNEDFIAGHALGFADLEDAYQYVAANKIGRIDYIVTQNLKDFKRSAIPVITPAALLKLF
jgi:predicted nucleic acid-binding protein